MVEYLNNFTFPLLLFGIGLGIGSLIGSYIVLFYILGRRLSIIQIIFSVDLIEHIIIWLTPVAIVLYLNCDSCTIITFLKVMHYEHIYLLGLLLLGLGVYFLINCYLKDSYTKNYNHAVYAKLRAERAEYTIWAGMASLLMFVFKEPTYLRPEAPESIFILTAFYFLLLVSIYYRHLCQAIYMQEAKKPK